MATPNTTPSGNADEDKSSSYNRWSLLDQSTISYGYYSSSKEDTPTSTNISSDAPSNKGFYITTAINYTNGPAHMGHAYESATTDAIARFARMMTSSSSSTSAPAYFVTGADEHGEKIAKTAENEGKEPIDICNKVCLFFLLVCVCVFVFILQMISFLYIQFAMIINI